MQGSQQSMLAHAASSSPAAEAWKESTKNQKPQQILSATSSKVPLYQSIPYACMMLHGWKLLMQRQGVKRLELSQAHILCHNVQLAVLVVSPHPHASFRHTQGGKQVGSGSVLTHHMLSKEPHRYDCSYGHPKKTV